MNLSFENPFKPGAGHNPPYLAGRTEETNEFLKLINQKTILSNLVLTGLRGVGKTVLLNRFKSLAIENKWLWVGTDLSESASISEHALAHRLITDIASATSHITFNTTEKISIGFSINKELQSERLSYENLLKIYESIPGLAVDKLKGVLEIVWHFLKSSGHKGLIFAYDEAQTIDDQSAKDQYPVALLLDTFQSIQRKDIPFMLALAGLPTLFPKLVDSRTFAERMFRIVFLNKLSPEESREAIVKPIEQAQCPIKFSDAHIKVVVQQSAGYPYFIQYLCKEIYDGFIQQRRVNQPLSIPIDAIINKLDSDFFAGRWAKVTDRQRDLLAVIALLESDGEEFTVQEIASASKQYPMGSFSSSHVNQMLVALAKSGLVYKNRYGKYSFAVPLLEQFIRRQNILTKKPV
ncbi:MAG: hypothetical protein COW13_01385 [Candidatus Omnitrophica bacterium CG12_big_fil_rev_8_21_14_0_65_50_5]|nr:MAG: hypothetical protein COW13_01385 [Candidatus Omnitrophica bacterium CG12_big_fil_rev_8_21_14_0_65_50_5]